MNRLIPRLVVKRVRPAGVDKARYGLFAEEIAIEVYEADPLYLLVQPPSGLEVAPIPPGGVVAIAEPPHTSYCRWHSGPIERPDNPLERIYCNLPASDYCRQHKKTPRALYERCVTLRGEKGLAYCSMLDKSLKAEYAVYLTDYGGHRPKVGMTRSFRVLDRIAEQPHITATILATLDSAVEARKLETSISSSGLAVESRSRRPPAARGIGESAARLASWAEEIAKRFGLDWNGRLLRIAPPQDISSYRDTRKPPTSTPLLFKGYWGGYLLLSPTRGKGGYRINFRRLQHADTLKTTPGSEPQ